MLGDTIHAVASPPGAAPRGVLRLSGPDAFPIAAALLSTDLPRARAITEHTVLVLGFPVPCRVLTFVAPASYTGEDVVELHLPGSPLLLETVRTDLEGRARVEHRPCRPALPGEYTRRAFENGKLDLAAAEAVCDLIHAASEDERARALASLTGGLSDQVDSQRGALLDALALLEIGLDFEEMETGAIERSAWLPVLEGVVAAIDTLIAGLPPAQTSGELALLGAANAGKSSLCNALAGRDEVMVAAVPGTTRDVLRVDCGGGLVLLDAPGDVALRQGVDGDSLALRDRLLADAGGFVVVVDGTAPALPEPRAGVVAVAVTRGDQGAAAEGPWRAAFPGVRVFVVGLVADEEGGADGGEGVAELGAFLRTRARGGPSGRGERLRGVLGGAREALGRAVAGARAGEPDEVVAVGVRETLAALGQVHGRSSPEDVLDRVFGQFCLGK